MFSQGKCLDLASPDSDIILIQSDDIIHTQDNSVELICKTVGPKKLSLAEVVSIPVANNLFENFHNNIKTILSKWNSYIIVENTNIDGVNYMVNNLYSGKVRAEGSWLFFCGAISRKDLEFLEFEKVNCDAVIGPKMRQNNFVPNFPPVKTIHQQHPKFAYPCPIVNSCKYNCIRKTDHINRSSKIE